MKRQLTYVIQTGAILALVALANLIGWSLSAHAYKFIPVQMILVAINIVVFFSQFAIRRRLGP